MFKKIMNISCTQATLLACKKETNKITLKETLQLKLHNTICSGCKNFAAQYSFIGQNAKNAAQYNTDVLSPKKKQAIKEMMI